MYIVSMQFCEAEMPHTDFPCQRTNPHWWHLHDDGDIVYIWRKQTSQSSEQNHEELSASATKQIRRNPATTKNVGRISQRMIEKERP